MSKAFPNSHNATVRHMSAGMADSLEGMNIHQANADQLQLQATSNADEPGVTCWQSPQQLRECAHEQDLAEASLQEMYAWGAKLNKAQVSAYRHNCYCKAREVVARVPELIAKTSAQVSALFTIVADAMSSPPVQLTAPNILATCHASNAPGLSRIAMTYMAGVHHPRS
jgi:hypothetical protein